MPFVWFDYTETLPKTLLETCDMDFLWCKNFLPQLCCRQRLLWKHFPHQVYGLAQCPAAWSIPLVTLVHLSCLCPLQPLVHPQGYSLREQYEKQKRLWHCVSTAHQQLKHWWVSNMDSVTNLDHRTIQTVMEKNNIPAISSTPGYLLYGYSRTYCYFCVPEWPLVR